MKRVKLEVAYDGTGYHGWQFQPNAVTIEGVLNRHLSELLKEEIIVIGASRTDAGVHARGNVAVFDTAHRLPADKIYLALNQRLPADIRVQSSAEVGPDWHPRKQKCTKFYEYRISNRRVELPSERLYTHFCSYGADLEPMRRAAGYLLGEHDFKSFCSVKTQAESTVRTIYAIDIQSRDEIISIKISGNGFLYNMVRIVAGTLLQVGCGRIAPEKMAEILAARDRCKAGPTLAARGLTLIGMKYEKNS